MKGIKNVRQGFTLLELLVVVLIIGILAAIALPQYRSSVMKARVASILPIMRHWKDALTEYKLQHGNYCRLTQGGDCADGSIDASDYGANWPSDWKNYDGDACGDSLECVNDYWNCWADTTNGGVICVDKNETFGIMMYQQDDDENCICRGACAGKIICAPGTEEGEKICKKLGSPAGEVDELQCTQIGG